MSSTEWGIIVGVVLAVSLAVMPWMFMVHAELAQLSAKVDKLTPNGEETP